MYVRQKCKNLLVSIKRCMLISACFCPFLKVERQSRKLFLWKIAVHEQKEKVYEMRTYNEALVINMLPEHVAKHFLGAKKRDEVREIPILE